MPRPGLNNDLLEHLVARGGDARQIIEAEVSVNEHVRVRELEWDAADSTSGMTTNRDGGVVITGTGSTLVTHGTEDDDVTDLNETAPRFVAQINWGGTHASDTPLTAVELYLDPDVDGKSGKNVDQWGMQVYALAQERVNAYNLFARTTTPLLFPQLHIHPITNRVKVTAGPSAGVVSFSLVGNSSFLPTPKAYLPDTDAVAAGSNVPRSYIFLWALDADGNPATNVGWQVDTAAGTSIVSNGNTLSQHKFIKVTGDRSDGLYEDLGAQTGVPKLTLKAKAFTEQTITFSSGNLFDLGAAPSGDDVELVGRGDTPDDSSLTFQVWDDANADWVTYTDGQKMTADLGLTPTRLRKFRCTLTPNTNFDVTPILRAMGMKDLTLYDLSDFAEVDGLDQQFDPITLKGKITEALIVVLATGSPGDTNDPMGDILVAHNLEAINFRLSIGHRSLARSKWLHIDTFLVDDYDLIPGGYRFYCVSPLITMRAALPKVGVSTVDALQYTNQTLTAVYDDLMDGQAGLAGKHRGPGINDSTTVTHRGIKDGDAKEELDNIAALAQYTTITSQGRLKAVEVNDGAPTKVHAIFPRSIVEPLHVTPGFRARLTDVRVKWKYNADADEFEDEERAFSGDAIVALGNTRIDKYEVDKSLSQWIDTQALAQSVGQRLVNAFGTGLILWEFRSSWPHPELELGDAIAIETDQFVARDPSQASDPLQARALRGTVWAFGRIQAIRDVWGTRFVVWIQSYANIQAGSTALSRLGFSRPEVLSAKALCDHAGNITVQVKCKSAGSVRVAGSTSAFPSRATTQAAGVVALGTGGNATTGTIISVLPTQNAFLSILAYEKSDGTGGESTDLYEEKYLTLLDGPPETTIAFGSLTATTLTVNMTAVLGNNGQGPLKVRYRSKVDTGNWTDWTAWLAAPQNGVTFTRHVKHTVTVQAQARDEGLPNFVGDVGFAHTDGPIVQHIAAPALPAISAIDGNTITQGAIIAAESFSATRVALGDAVSPTTGVALKIGTNYSGNGRRQLAVEGRITATANDQPNSIGVRVGTELAKGGFTGLEYAAFVVDATLSGSGTVTNYYGAFLSDPSLPAGALTNSYGLYIPDRAVGTNTWAIYTNLGKVRFGDAVTIVGQASPLLKLDQGGQDGDILRFASSDVAHGMTSIIPTDVYAAIRKFAGFQGGIQIRGFVETGSFIGAELFGVAGTGMTTKSASGKAPVMIHAEKKNGTTVQNLGTNENLCAFTLGGNTTRFILDADGDSHQDVGTVWTNFDPYPDVVLLDALSAGVSRPGDPLREHFRATLEAHRPELERLRLVTFNADGHHFINWSRTHMLVIGAVRQVAARVTELEQETLWQTLRRRLRARSSASLPMSSAV